MNVLQAAAYLTRRNACFFVVLAIYALVVTPLYFLRVIHSDVIVTTAIFFVVVMGLDLLYGCTGMLSFGQVGFFAVGAYAVAILFTRLAIPPLFGALIGILVNIALSYVLGRVCLRLATSYFMLATLAFGIMIHGTITVWYDVTGGDGGLGDIPRPVIGTSLNTDLSFGAFAASCAVVLFWFTYNLSRSRVGRALRAIRSDATAAACLGVNVDQLKISAFVISACYASFGGSLFAMYNGAVHPDSFSLGALLDLLLMMFIGGEGTIWGGLWGTTVIRLLPDVLSGLHGAKILFSGIFFCIIIFALPRGIAGAIEDIVKRIGSRTRPRAATGAQAIPYSAGIRTGTAAVLRIDSLARSFGGVRAIDDVSFEIRRGQIKGLIGPNGAGKTTLLNLISGLLTPDGGRILVESTELRQLRPDQIARLGIQRTFQHERLFPYLSVEENIMVGQECGIEGGLSDLIACALGHRQTLIAEAEARRNAKAWLRSLQLEEYAGRSVEKIPQGLRKLIEVARSCAAAPLLLLLDEAVAGLNGPERQVFKGFIRALHDAGLTILIIEHDIDFVMELCDDICVVSFGKTIADGTPAEIRKDAAVIAAYLGR
jgi:ABC-type branched-subunit amino acid transport system ATPase component/ABC-type branched-subunit amino acid transport system permease subunit